MASLSLGPALKAQFMASAGNAEQSLTPFEDGITGNGKADHQDQASKKDATTHSSDFCSSSPFSDDDRSAG
eukprot:367994-Rhodomonas_salina.1